MAITLPDLPYEKDALEPAISARTLEFHHDKHHHAYVAKLNELIRGTSLEGEDLEAIIMKTAIDTGRQTIFNNAAQVWNHTFYWNCMKPGGGGKPMGEIASRINTDLGGFEDFANEFKNAGTTQFGSGWAWLVVDNGKLKITKTPNADNPLTKNQRPLLTVDVWEHAYYLDYQNRRADYINTFIEKLINWDFVNANLSASLKMAAAKA